MSGRPDGYLLEVSGVHKRFAKVTALSGVSFGIRQGEVQPCSVTTGQATAR